jgi:hypothetical protein
LNYFTVSLELVKTLADFRFSEHEIKTDDIGVESEENAIKTRLFELGYQIRFKRHYLFNLIKADFNEDRDSAKRELENFTQFESINGLIKDYRKTEKIYEYRFQ